MAHNITERDGLFVVRDAAWHGLGTVLPDYPTREQAQQLAHPWEPTREPVYRKVVTTRVFGHPVTEYQEVDGWVLNARSDDGHPIGVVSDTWTTVKNSEMYDIAEAIEGEQKGRVRYETGGSLLGGRKVWLLLRMAEPLYVKGDPNGAVIPYYALQNSHDGTGSFRGQATMTRIVCDNTAQMADLDAKTRGTEFVFRHTRNVADRIEQAKQALAGWAASLEAWDYQCRHLLALPVTKYQRDRFITEFVPDPMPHSTTDRVVANVAEARAAIASILLSPTCDGINDTAYGLVQASVEYLQHVRRAKSNETRFKRAYLDRSTLVSDAVELAVEVATS